jgi:hypothetical protein
MRFHAPARSEVTAACFNHPLYADFGRYGPLLTAPNWPPLEVLNQYGNSLRHRYAGQPLQFVAQTPALLADGLHYEARIYRHGAIATRPESWHDLFNALMWLERFALKSAVNAAYVREFAARTGEPRTRAQCALTHFDEAGAVVVLEDTSLLALWDRHDWAGLFAAEGFSCGARVYLFGHALLEQGLVPWSLPVAKCLVVVPEDADAPGAILEAVADAIANGELLRDPTELRPLPLVGQSGWHSGQAEPAFFKTTPCFRPLRPGRRYPAPSSLRGLRPQASRPANGDVPATGAALQHNRI